MSGPPEPAGQARCSGICNRQINSFPFFVTLSRETETEHGAELRMRAKLKATRRKGGRKAKRESKVK